MGKFDPIDIFFIAIISTYFITLICFFITYGYIKLTTNKNNLKENTEKHKQNLKVENKKTVSLISRIKSASLFKKLFLKEVKTNKAVDKELPKTKILVKSNIKIDSKNNKENKPSVSKEIHEPKKRISSSKTKSSTKPKVSNITSKKQTNNVTKIKASSSKAKTKATSQKAKTSTTKSSPQKKNISSNPKSSKKTQPKNQRKTSTKQTTSVSKNKTRNNKNKKTVAKK